MSPVFVNRGGPVVLALGVPYADHKPDTPQRGKNKKKARTFKQQKLFDGIKPKVTLDKHAAEELDLDCPRFLQMKQMASSRLVYQPWEELKILHAATEKEAVAAAADGPYKEAGILQDEANKKALSWWPVKPHISLSRKQ